MNVRTITEEDLAKYPEFLKGKSVGDTITAQEDFEMRKAAGEVDKPLDASTGLTNLPSSIESTVDEKAEGKDAKPKSKK